MKKTTLFSLIPAMGTIIGCGPAPAPPQNSSNPNAYTIVTTTGMVGDLALAAAGEQGNVKSLMGSGIDPHLYSPTRGDVIALQGADIVFYNGLHLEGQMTDVLHQLGREGKPVAGVSHPLEAIDGYLMEEHGQADPHVWMDLAAWKLALGEVTQHLIQFDPENATVYESNAAAYRLQLEGLDAYVKKVIASIPESQRVLVTAHDAFSYFGRAYAVDVRGIQGISTESEAGIRDIEDLVAFLVEKNIPAVFVESSVADKNVRALVEGAAAKNHSVRIGGELFSDAMGAPGSYEGTYIGMMDHNATLIARALGGEAPKTGFQGKLTPRTEDAHGH